MVPQVLPLLKYVRFSCKVTLPMPETAQERSGFSEFQMERIIHESSGAERKRRRAEWSVLTAHSPAMAWENAEAYVRTLGKHDRTVYIWVWMGRPLTLRLNQDCNFTCHPQCRKRHREHSRGPAAGTRRLPGVAEASGYFSPTLPSPYPISCHP